MSSTSKIFDNKQLIHIGAEMVVLVCLTFYFSSKNRKLMEHIEELAQRAEEQEDHIHKLESAVNNLGNMIQTQVIPRLTGQVAVNSKPQPRPQPRPRPRSQPRFVQPVIKPKRSKAIIVEEPVYEKEENENENDEEELEEEELESDLDEEITEELMELEEQTENLEMESHLKKGE